MTHPLESAAPDRRADPETVTASRLAMIGEQGAEHFRLPDEPHPMPVIGMIFAALSGLFAGGLIVWLATRNWGEML